MHLGINELFEGPTQTRDGHKYILPPSSFAEAAIGLMTQSEVKLCLDEVLDDVIHNPDIEAPAIRYALEKGKGTVGLEDVLNRVRAQHEKRGKLITNTAVRQESMTGGGVLSFEIERRGDSRKARNRSVTLEIDSDGRILQYDCPCETHTKNFARGNYNKLFGGASKNVARPAGGNRQSLDISGFPMFVTNVACYHIAAALTHVSRTRGIYVMPFEFTKINLFEALFMGVFRRVKDATIDDYLIRQGALTQETLMEISEGNLTLEVVKHMKNIDSRAQTIIGRIKQARENDGYTFSGFAMDFRGTPYQTASIVLTKLGGRSVHVLYDSRFGVSMQRAMPRDSKLETSLPLIMLNIPVFVWMNEGRQHVTGELTGDPVGAANTYLRRFDERTQNEVVSRIARPEEQFLTSVELVTYRRIFAERKPEHQFALT